MASSDAWMPVQDAAEQEQADRLERLPAQLLNNAAVLHMRGGEAHAALGLIEEAVQVSAASSTPASHRSRAETELSAQSKVKDLRVERASTGVVAMHGT